MLTLRPVLFPLILGVHTSPSPLGDATNFRVRECATNSERSVANQRVIGEQEVRPQSSPSCGTRPERPAKSQFSPYLTRSPLPPSRPPSPYLPASHYFGLLAPRVKCPCTRRELGDWWATYCVADCDPSVSAANREAAPANRHVERG